MTDFGTMSVTRSLSISTRNPSTSSGISHFQSGFGGIYGNLPIKEHSDISSVTYPGFYRSHHGDFFSPRPTKPGSGLTTPPVLTAIPPATTCHQQQAQQGRRRSEWITFSKPFLLKLVEKLCQLSFENETVSSPAAEVNGQGHGESTNPSSTPANSLNVPSSVNPTASKKCLGGKNQTNDENKGWENIDKRKSRSKLRPVKFVRPFESSEERQKSEEESDCGNVNVESDGEAGGISKPAALEVVSSSNSAPVLATVAALTTATSSRSSNAGGLHKETLKREREACEDSDTEHINVEDDDDDDDVDANTLTSRTQMTFENFQHKDKSVSESAKEANDNKPKSQPISRESPNFGKSRFNPVEGSAQIFNPLWSTYFNLTPTFQPRVPPTFNPRSSKDANQLESNKQCWAAFNKNLVYRMFDDVLDNDNCLFNNSSYPSATSSTLHNARLIFAGHSDSLNLHATNGFNKHLGVCGYDISLCGGDRSLKAVDVAGDKSGKKSTLAVKSRKMRDGFPRARHQFPGRRNRTKNSMGSFNRNSAEMDGTKEKETISLCDVPILGALLRSDDSKLYNSHRPSHYNNINNTNTNNISNKDAEQQHDIATKTSTTSNNNNNNGLISCNNNNNNVPLKNGIHTNNNNNNNNNNKVDGWPKWVALDKCQVKSLVDSLVVSMMATDAQSSPAHSFSFSSSLPLPPPPLPPLTPIKSRDNVNKMDGTDSEMQVDGNGSLQIIATNNNNNNNRETVRSGQQDDDSNSATTATRLHVDDTECAAASDNVNRDSETETNFSGETQLDPSDVEELERYGEDMSDDCDYTSGNDWDDRKCASSHQPSSPCPIKWKSNMLMRMKAENRKTFKES